MMNDDDVARLTTTIGGLIESTSGVDQGGLRDLRRDLLRCVENEGDGWAAVRDRIAEALARKLTDPSKVPLAIERVEVLDTIETESGDERRDVSTGLSASVLRAFLVRSSAEERVAFYKSMNAHGPWKTVSLALSDRARTPEEVVLFDQCYAATSGGGIGDIADGVAAWAIGHPGKALELVRRRARREGPLALCRPRLLQILVESLSRRGMIDAAAREECIVSMLGEFETDARSAAMAIECFAWPHETAIETRHAAVLRRLHATPVFAVPAMEALTRDAYEHGTTAVRSAVEVLRVAVVAGAPQPVRAELVGHAAHLAAAAYGRDDANTDPAAIDDLLPYLLEIPLADARRGLGLESLLSALLRSRHLLVRQFLGAWLSRQAQALRHARRPLREVLSLVAHRLGPVRSNAWLVKFLCHPSTALRVAAAALLGADDEELPLAAFNDVRADEAIALAHEIAGQPDLGVRSIEMILALAVARPDGLDAIARIVCENLVTQYPGACRERVSMWSRPPISTTRALGRRFRVAKAAVEQRLSEASAAHAAKIAIPELTTISPAFEQWRHAEQRAMDRSHRAAYRGSFVSMIATNVTICRGSATSVMGGADMPLQEFSFSREFGFASHVDPIGASERQLASLILADRLRKGLVSE